jgi:predicted porin
MKKFLLGTTALISMSAASAAFAGGSHAPAPAAPANTGGLTVMVGGNYNFQWVSRDDDEAAASNQRNQIIRNDTVLDFTASGSTDSFDYGAVIQLNADANQNKFGQDDGRKTYLYVENDSVGRFEAGQNVGASNTLEVDASKIARATGGSNGDREYNLAARGISTGTSYTFANGAYNYITTPNLPTADEDTTAGLANKITYYTPRFSGLQFGISYAPDSGDTGSASGITTDANAGQYGDIISGGLNFESDISDGVTMMASLVGETGTAEQNSGTGAADFNDLNAYSVGLGFEFGGFSIAGNWADLGDSGIISTATSNDNSNYWTVGAAYENGPYGLSVTYLDSTAGQGTPATTTINTGDNELTNVVVGADYQMAPGLVPFVEASFFDFQNGSTNGTGDNTGNVVMVGANLAF